MICEQKRGTGEERVEIGEACGQRPKENGEEMEEPPKREKPREREGKERERADGGSKLMATGKSQRMR